MEKNTSFFNDVIEKLDHLYSTVMDVEDSLMDSIAKLAKERKTHLITRQLILADKIKEFSVKVEHLKSEWLSINSEEQLIESKKQGSEKKGVHERTDWWVADSFIKIETRRLEGSPYSNVFPIKLFKEIAKVASDFVYHKNFVKTSDVLNILQDEIISQSDYKRRRESPSTRHLRFWLKKIY